MSDLYQLRYEGSGPLPTARQVEAWGRHWIKTGIEPRGVKITPIEWSAKRRSAEQIRRRLKRAGYAFFGCPGVVRNYSEPNQILCDFDSPQKPNLRPMLRLLESLLDSKALVRYYKTKRGWHAVIRWSRRFKPIEIVTIQAILGSDPRRESFNLARVLSGRAQNRRWNLLFEKKLKG